MPHKRKNKPPPKSVGKAPIRHLSEDESDDPDPQSRNFIYDEVDEYQAADDKILFDGARKESSQKKTYESVMTLSSGSDDESEVDEDYGDFYSSMAQKDEMASDIEDNEEEDFESTGWGKRKGDYYDTDYIDQDYGGYHGSDAEMAEEEEKEAMAIQKRLLEQLDEDDFGLDWIKKPLESKKTETQIEEKIALDLSKLSKNEKLEYLKKESPECLELIEDFKAQLSEVEDRLEPLVKLINKGEIPAGPGANYVLLKRQLIMIYCTNISFYLLLKCRGTSITSHPVLKRLATFKKLLQQLEDTDVKMSLQINEALEKITLGQLIEVHEEVIKKPKRKLKILKDLEMKKQLEEDKITEPKAKKIRRLETEDERKALEMYEMLKAGRKADPDDEDDEENEEENIENELGGGVEGGEEEGGEEENEKRGITYQIAKNKGLMPHRKKEYRNPRVKHRMKFRRANIRRKGQVKEPRKELDRYGGELSGIRIGVKHGIKLK